MGEGAARSGDTYIVKPLGLIGVRLSTERRGYCGTQLWGQPLGGSVSVLKVSDLLGGGA